MTKLDTDDHSGVPGHLFQCTPLLPGKRDVALTRNIAAGDGLRFSDLGVRLGAVDPDPENIDGGSVALGRIKSGSTHRRMA